MKENGRMDSKTDKVNIIMGLKIIIIKDHGLTIRGMETMELMLARLANTMVDGKKEKCKVEGNFYTTRLTQSIREILLTISLMMV